MFKQILIAIDTSPMGEIVFQEGLSMAHNNQSEILLLHVLSSEEENSPLPIPPNLTAFYPAAGNELTLELWQQQWENYEQQGLEMLAKFKKKAQDFSLKIDTQQIYGSPCKTICKIAQQKRADLIVIGHRGLRGLSELLLGSVSNYVLHHAHCSVLIVQYPKSSDL